MEMSLLNELELRCEGLSTRRLYFCGLALLAVVGIVDFITGPEISVSILYLIPVALVSWYAEKPAGYVISIASAVVWLVIDQVSINSYSNPLIASWNGLVRLMFFSLTAYLLLTLKSYLGRESVLLRIDKLTGAKNAQAFRDEMRFLLKLAARHQHPITLAYLSLDNFKQANASLGEEEGDRILQTIVMALTLSCRSTDVVGRLGGDEFAILLPETDLAGAKTTFDKLHDRIRAILEDQGWSVGLSAGVAVFPEQPPNVAEAMQYAASLLRRAKTEAAGKLVYEVFPESKPAPWATLKLGGEG